MKTVFQLTIVSSLLLAAGCSSWHERHAKYEENNQQFSSYPSTGTASTSSSSTYQPSTSQSTTTATIGETIPQQLNVPGSTENKIAAGGTSDQTTSSQSTGTQSSQPTTAQSGNEQFSTNPAAQPAPIFGQSGTTQSTFGQSSQSSALTPTDRGSTTDEQKRQDQNLSPTSYQQRSSRVYGTNQANFRTSGTDGNFN